MQATKKGISRRLRAALAVFVAFVVVVAPAWAQNDPDQAAKDELDPKLLHWKWMQELKLPAKADGKYVALSIARAVFGSADPNRNMPRAFPDQKIPVGFRDDFGDSMVRDPRDSMPTDLRDLRIADANGKRVPYALRIMRKRLEQRDVHFEKIDDGWGATSRTYQWTLELAQNELQPPGHNEIEIHTSGSDFRRRVVAEGADSKAFKDPRTILDSSVMRFTIGGRLVEQYRFHYDFKQFRHLRVRVYPDLTLEKDKPRITQIVVRRSIVAAGEFATDKANLGPVQAVRGDGGPGTAWLIEFPSRMPVEKLSFEVKGPPSDRPFRLQVANPRESRYDIGIGDWNWRQVADKDGTRMFLDISFPEVISQGMRLIVTDYANPPLQIDSAQATRCVRKLIIENPDPAEFKLPLRLYVGNTNVGAANYVLAQKLPVQLKPAPAVIEAGELIQNPVYVPPSLTLHERAPWLVYVVLGIACAVLLVILGGLARQAIGHHDAQAATEAKPT